MWPRWWNRCGRGPRQRGRDRGQGVPGRHHIPGQRSPARHRQHRAGADHARVRADPRTVGRVQGRPAAGHGQGRGDAGQGLTGLDDVLRGGGARRGDGHGGGAHRGAGDLGKSTRSADVRLGPAGGLAHASYRHDGHQDAAPGEHRARGLPDPRSPRQQPMPTMTRSPFSSPPGRAPDDRRTPAAYARDIGIAPPRRLGRAPS